MELWQLIMNVPGLTGTWQQRLNEFGRRFYGSGYTGNLNQNLDLINRINKGDYGQSIPTQSGGSTVNDYIKGITGQDKANAVRPFQEVLPQDQYLSAMNAKGIAEARIAPEENLKERNTFSNFDTARNSTGNNRFGSYFSDRGTVATQLTQGRNERVGTLQSALEDQFMKQYQELVDMYYKDPNIDVFKMVPAAATPAPAPTPGTQGASYSLPFN